MNPRPVTKRDEFRQAAGMCVLLCIVCSRRPLRDIIVLLFALVVEFFIDEITKPLPQIAGWASRKMR